MFRIDTPGATPDNRFTEGDPTIPTPATMVSADWLTSVQEELLAVIEGAGIAANKAARDQLKLAITSMVTSRLPQLATTELAGLVRRATDADIAAGTNTEFYVTPAHLAKKADINASNFSQIGTARLASYAMPSDRYIDINLGASGSTYTTPAEGYLCVGRDARGDNFKISLRNQTTKMTSYGYGSTDAECVGATLWCKKSNVIQYKYSGVPDYARFIFAEGAY